MARLSILVGVAAGVLVCVSTAPAAVAQQPTIEGLAWMAGCWHATVDNVEMEEHWMAPAGGVMLGLHRDTFPSGKVFFEYLRIVGSEDGTSYVASPGGREPTVFTMTETGERRAVFENPNHDFPQRISYWSDGETLSAKVDGQAGDERSVEWTWTRVDCDGS